MANELTKEMGEYIRDSLRADTTFLNYLDIALVNAKDKILFTENINDISKFINPMVIVSNDFSDSSELDYTGIYTGTEVYQVFIWNNEGNYATSQALDRIDTLFNKSGILFSKTSPVGTNIGEFKVNGKINFKDSEKENTIKGEINIQLNIGGI